MTTKDKKVFLLSADQVFALELVRAGTGRRQRVLGQPAGGGDVVGRVAGSRRGFGMWSRLGGTEDQRPQASISPSN